METVYYDIETDNQYAPYAKLNLIGLLWNEDGEIEILEWEKLSAEEKTNVRALFADPTLKKVGFNNCNFDDIVLANHGIPVEETNRHDAFLAIKAAFPELPNFSLKYLNWHFFGDFHWPEYYLEVDQQKKKKSKFEEADEKLLEVYNAHDLRQHKRIWDYVEPFLKGRTQEAYNLDRSVGKPVEEMALRGGLFVNESSAEDSFDLLLRARERNMQRAFKISKGRITNANSAKQLSSYFDEEGFEMELTEKGNFKIDKSLIADIWRLNPVALCTRNIRKIDSIIKYHKRYLEAVRDESYKGRRMDGFIPVSVSISTAKTRRFTSSSKYKINFQNCNDDAKKVQFIPPGWLGWWRDATQIENVVHIYESKDHARRKAYENDPEWSEYVWLCNEILGTNLTKKELDKIKSDVNANWTVYKQYKTIKLMLNFGAGVKKFSQVTKFPVNKSKVLFEDIHRACKAIRKLQKRVERDLRLHGEVYDVFGHVYRGRPEMAYKVVAYLIQGCGTGSLPKAQIRAIYDIQQKYKKIFGRDVAFLSVPTHDEISGRIDLSIGEEMVEQILKEFEFVMSGMFSPKFDNIPLRSKLYLSTTTTKKRREVSSYAEFREKELAGRN